MSNLHRIDRSTIQPSPGLGIPALDSPVCGFFEQALASATKAVYSSSANRYSTFCTQLILSPLPLTQDTVTHFVAYLAQSGMTYMYQLNRSYLSGIRFLQIVSGLPDPHMEAFPLSNYVLRGVHRFPLASPNQPRCPITPHMLHTLFSAW